MSEPKRVLLVTPDYPPPPGGIQSLTANLEAGLLACGVDVRVLVADAGRSDATPSDLLSVGRWAHSVRSAVSGEALSLGVTYRRAASLIEAFRPDVVHAMHIADWPALVAASEREVPSVVTTYALELGRTSLARSALAEATVVHAVSEYTAALTRTVADEPIDTYVASPSIDTSAYPNGRSAGPDDPSERSAAGTATITTVARLVERKNVETLIDAVNRLDERLERDVVLRVIGEGPQRDELERLASSAPVRFEGWVSEGRKRKLLAAADVFALLPRQIGFDVEGFGMVYIEAQAAGTPVLGSCHGGVPEAIGNGGLVVEDERDPAAAATALEELLTDECTRARCLDAAANRIDRFDRRTIAARHLEAYESAGSNGTDSSATGPGVPSLH